MSLSLFAPVSTHRWGRLRPVALVLVLAVGAHLGAARVPAVAQKAAPKGNPRVTMVVEKRGEIVIELLPQAAPKTVAHFLDLVKKKFYDGILFHRYVEGFVVQGGDPKSKEVDGSLIKDIPATQVGEQYGLGGGGSGKNVPLEAKLKHARGSVGLARSNAPDSGDSQFFFNLMDNTGLDERQPGYCVFGKVVKGMDVMDKLRQGDRIKSIRLAAEKNSKKK